MSWPVWFINALSEASKGWIVTARRYPWIPTIDSIWQASSAPLDGHVEMLGAESRSRPLPAYTPSLAGVQVRAWQNTGGGFSLHVVGNSNFRQLSANIAPGSMLAIHVGNRQHSPDTYPRIDLGVYQQATQLSGPDGPLPIYRIDCAPWWAALRRRPAANFASKLFNYAGSETSVSGTNYTAGASTITLTSAATMQRQAGGTGVIQVTDNSGGTFFLKWTGVSGNVLTIDSTALSGSFGTTAANANIGNSVKNVVYLRGHPARILRRILTSTGTADFTAGTAGDNGDFDVYPETWGYGIDRSDVDTASLTTLRDDVMKYTGATGQYLVEILVESAPDNALDWFRSWMAPLGMFFRCHQGDFSAWAAQNPSASDALFSSYGVTDDLMLSQGFTWQPVGADGQHNSSSLTNAAGTSSSSALSSDYKAAPVYATRDRNVTGIIRADLSDHADDVNDRLSCWDVRTLSRLGGQWGGFWHGRLGLGELTHVTTNALRLYRPDQAYNGTYLQAAPAIVTAGPALDIFNARVLLGLTLIPPES